MKFLSLIFLLSIAITGCGTPKRTEINFDHSLKTEVANRVVSSIERTPTYQELNRRAKRSLLDVDEEQGGWVRVDMYSIGREINHRWATMKVNAQSGLAMKLDWDEHGEDRWMTEYSPY
jgi:hypothetical protein